MFDKKLLMQQIVNKQKSIEEQMQSPDIKSVVADAVTGINNIDRSQYRDHPQGERLYQAEVKMHMDKAKMPFHPRHHDEIHSMIMDRLSEINEQTRN